MNQVTLRLMLHSCEKKLDRINILIEHKEAEDNASIQAAHEEGSRLSEHYWQESHKLRAMKASAEMLRDILLETLEEGKDASKIHDDR